MGHYKFVPASFAQGSIGLEYGLSQIVVQIGAGDTVEGESALL
jgi:hypothetical protein